MRLAPASFAIALALAAPPGSALDKQGSAHGGNIGGESEGTGDQPGLGVVKLHRAYETDMPVDRSGLTQTYAYALGAWNFDFRGEPAPLETRGQVHSP
jgi:hypothetical protein